MHRDRDCARLVGGQHEMHVIRHQDVGIHRHSMPVCGFLQEVLERCKVLGARKDVLPIVTAMGQMNGHVRGKASGRSWHVVLTRLRSIATTKLLNKWYVAPFLVSACSLLDPHNMIGRQMGE